MINYLNSKLILFEDNKTDKKQILKKIVDIMYENSDKIKNKDKFLENIFKREEAGTTGIGRQIVVPHARCEELEGIVMSVTLLKTPIDFNTPDGEPAKIIIMVGAPTTKNTEYLKLLSRISRVFRDKNIREDIITSESKEEILEIIASIEL
ncbi:PTS system nitrogen regulatory IIA component [Hypnocyclicus thermotrophus]|uniref:PTS system nitrogen regulatory IIA component n=1 Tax=Hypnocyclicus thermotrophus TaxID=1627895 RepID=A0AA46I6L1_9FUSO|nr:PTS sugar transporter subunit IIA [Hypnocyclicus thermotrophus]TDT71891.1 PTS system nitrogen regulatory IIA component [Hypnocyclicus thermotrophus]